MGSVTFNTNKHPLVGSFVVQFSNETITVGNQNYTSYSTTHLMAMPDVLTHATATDYQLLLEYVHDVSNPNLQRLFLITGKLLYTSILEGIVALLIFSLVYFLWRKVTSTKGIPKTDSTPIVLDALTTPSPPWAL